MSIRPRRIVTAIVFAFIVATRAFGHQDTGIRRLADGQLEGLPEKYHPAYLRLPPEGTPGPVSLEVGAKRVDLPECMQGLFRDASRAHIALRASWYHDPAIMPPYLTILLPKGPPNPHGFHGGFEVMVNLDRASVMSLAVLRVLPAGTSQYREPIAPMTCEVKN